MASRMTPSELQGKTHEEIMAAARWHGARAATPYPEPPSACLWPTQLPLHTLAP